MKVISDRSAKSTPPQITVNQMEKGFWLSLPSSLLTLELCRDSPRRQAEFKRVIDSAGKKGRKFMEGRAAGRGRERGKPRVGGSYEAKGKGILIVLVLAKITMPCCSHGYVFNPYISTITGKVVRVEV